MNLLDRILNWIYPQPETDVSLETVAGVWSLSTAHAEFYVQIYASRNQLSYRQALDILQDMSLEDIRTELGES